MKITQPNGDEVGWTEYTYVDEVEDAMEMVVNSTKLQWSMFNNFNEQQFVNEESGENSTVNTANLGKFNHPIRGFGWG